MSIKPCSVATALAVTGLLACGPDASGTDATDTGVSPPTPFAELLECEPDLSPRCEHEAGDQLEDFLPLPCLTQALGEGQPGRFRVEFAAGSDHTAPHRRTLAIHEDGSVSTICESLFTGDVMTTGWRCDYIPPPSGLVLWTPCQCWSDDQVSCYVGAPDAESPSELMTVLTRCRPTLTCPNG